MDTTTNTCRNTRKTKWSEDNNVYENKKRLLNISTSNTAARHTTKSDLKK